MTLKLNLGCGRDYLDGYENLDISESVGADIVADITQGIPFEDDTFDEVMANNVLTQLERKKDFLIVMNELHRVTRGFIDIRVPLVSDMCAWQDPFDVRRFTPESFTYMETGHRRYEQYGKHYGFLPFRVEILENNGRQMKTRLWPIK